MSILCDIKLQNYNKNVYNLQLVICQFTNIYKKIRVTNVEILEIGCEWSKSIDQSKWHICNDWWILDFKCSFWSNTKDCCESINNINIDILVMIDEWSFGVLKMILMVMKLKLN